MTPCVLVESTHPCFNHSLKVHTSLSSEPLAFKLTHATRIRPYNEAMEQQTISIAKAGGGASSTPGGESALVSKVQPNEGKNLLFSLLST